jgi:hypothetical protein
MLPSSISSRPKARPAQERTNEVGLAGRFVKGMYAPVDASASQLIVGSREVSKGGSWRHAKCERENKVVRAAKAKRRRGTNGG